MVEPDMQLNKPLTCMSCNSKYLICEPIPIAWKQDYKLIITTLDNLCKKAILPGSRFIRSG